MKNILLLTDFSKNAQNAIDYALEFFKGGKYDFFVLNVHKPSAYTTGELMASTPGSSVYESLIKNPEKILDKLAEKLVKKYTTEAYEFNTICDFDNFTSSVNQVVKINNIDLIVMGTNGATGAKEVIFGSNTISVIRNVTCPVLIIPENFTYHHPVRSVLFASDAEETFESKKVNVFQSILTLLKARLHVLLINEIAVNTNFDKKELIAKFFTLFKPEFHVLENIPSDIAINSFVQLYPVDLVAKLINEEPFLKRLLSKSKTSALTYKIRVPLLLMHAGS